MTAATKTHCLIEVEWPEFGLAERPPAIEASELEGRLKALRSAMASEGLSHIVGYADREPLADQNW